jgi:hypothetical protein
MPLAEILSHLHAINSLEFTADNRFPLRHQVPAVHQGQFVGQAGDAVECRNLSPYGCRAGAIQINLDDAVRAAVRDLDEVRDQFGQGVETGNQMRQVQDIFRLAEIRDGCRSPGRQGGRVEHETISLGAAAQAVDAAAAPRGYRRPLRLSGYRSPNRHAGYRCQRRHKDCPHPLRLR